VLTLHHIYGICGVLEWLWVLVGYLCRLVFKLYILKLISAHPFYLPAACICLFRGVASLLLSYSPATRSFETSRASREAARQATLGARFVPRAALSYLSLACGLLAAYPFAPGLDSGKEQSQLHCCIFWLGLAGAWAETELDCLLLARDPGADIVGVQQEKVSRFFILPQHMKRWKAQEKVYYKTLYPNVIVR
jgi:hypothetical protein